MKNNKIYLLGCIVALLCFSISSCNSKFDDYNTNPNQSTKVTSSMLATNLILKSSLFSIRGDVKVQDVPKNFMKDDMLSKYLVWAESNDIDYAFNKLDRQSFSNMSMLNNVDKMVAAASERQRSAYEGLGHILRAYMFFNMTLRVGDMPYSEAMRGEEGIKSPVYDKQEDILAGLLNELDDADKLLKDAATFDGDPIYGGNPEAWRKAGNVLELKILLNLYRKVDDANLRVKERMQSIVSSRPIFQSNDDNWQLVHSNNSGQKYPFYEEGNNYKNFPFLSATIVDLLKQYKDRRLFYYAEMTPSAVANGISATEWDAYQGVEPSLVHTDIQQATQSGNISTINPRYLKIPEGEPSFLLSYSEMNFILAEAVVRGLLSGNAKAYYEEGIRSAMQFTDSHTPDNVAYHHGMKIDEAYISDYLQGSETAFASTAEKQIEQIIHQKYIATFMESPFSGFFEYRRTGYPHFIINPESNRNTPTDKMPVRWMYSQDEYNYNAENVNTAVQSQFNGVDDNNQLMWILK